MAAALIFSLIAAGLVFAALQNRGAGGGSGAPLTTTAVVVAARDIPANTKLTAGMLELRSLPVAAQLAGAFTASDSVIGLPARYPIEAGEQITPAKVGLYQIDDENDVALILPPGSRAVAVPLTEVTGVGGMLLPGNFVDVVAVYANGIGGTAGAGSGTSFMLLQDVEVLAVGQEAQEAVPAQIAAADAGAPPSGASGVRPDGVERQPDARSATLAVTPEQAQMLALVQETGGAIWLSLRPLGDHEPVPAGEINLQQLESALAP